MRQLAAPWAAKSYLMSRDKTLELMPELSPIRNSCRNYPQPQSRELSINLRLIQGPRYNEACLLSSPHKKALSLSFLIHWLSNCEFFFFFLAFKFVHVIRLTVWFLFPQHDIDYWFRPIILRGWSASAQMPANMVGGLLGKKNSFGGGSQMHIGISRTSFVLLDLAGAFFYFWIGLNICFFTCAGYSVKSTFNSSRSRSRSRSSVRSRSLELYVLVNLHTHASQMNEMGL